MRSQTSPLFTFITFKTGIPQQKGKQCKWERKQANHSTVPLQATKEQVDTGDNHLTTNCSSSQRSPLVI